jgi:hypothetical protein
VRLINGIPEDQWGCWCPHGHRITMPAPDDDSACPAAVFVHPCPCPWPQCQPAYVAAQVETELAALESEGWREVGG